MALEKFSPRKPDLLDELNELRTRRGLAYRAHDMITLEQVHQEMKAFWLRNGWNESEAQEEYLIHAKECEAPYSETIDELSEIKAHLLLLSHS